MSHIWKDHLERRCPRLGGTVTVAYCRRTGEGRLPCPKVADCWWEMFDIATWLKNNLTPEELQQLLNTPVQPKLTHIFELIAQAQQRTGRKEDR